jgi:DNA helicase IV
MTMMPPTTEIEHLSDAARAILAEEEALLAATRAAIRRAAEARVAAPPTTASAARAAAEALSSLHDQAQGASEDDLPALLHEMGLRRELLDRARTDAGRAARAALLPDADSPYLAHLRLREGGRARDYLLGRVAFVDAGAGVRVVDWRVAPIAQIYYRYREGDAYEEERAGRVVEGTVEARRIVVIARGRLERVIAGDLTLTRGADGRWSEAAGVGLLAAADHDTTSGAPDVTALLDAEQHAAISAPPDRPLLVLGSAGSGKTTVALHRLARVAAASPDRHPIARSRVVVPEEGLARLSRLLLRPHVGAERAASQVATLDGWATDLARRVLGPELRLAPEEAPVAVSSLKRHPALYRALSAEPAPAAPPSLIRLRRFLHRRLSDWALLTRVVDDAAGTLPRGAIDETVRRTVLMMRDPLGVELASITDEERRRAIDDRAIDEGTPDAFAGTVDVEDLPILLWLWRRARGGRLLDGAPPVAQLVLDEAEDFSLFELDVLGALTTEGASITLAGDEAQQTSSSFAGWEAALAALGARDAALCRLETTYRCPRPIAELARRVLGPLAPPSATRAAREGAPVAMHTFPTDAAAELFVVEASRDLLDRSERPSLAIIARDADAARRLYGLLADRPDARLVLDGAFPFTPGLDVTDLDSVKGLEWDTVLVPDAASWAYPATDDARHRLHVAITRASRQLWLVAGGALSPLLT